MSISRLLLVLLLSLPLSVQAHHFVMGQPVTPVEISDRGELIITGDEISYHPWSSQQLAGKVRIVQYIAGRKSAKKKNSLLIKAVKAAAFPAGRFQPTTIVNSDDEFPGSGFFVRTKTEKNKWRYPWAQFVIDSNGTGRKTWDLKEGGSAIIVLDREGRVQWAKDGALTPDQVCQVLSLVRKLIDSDKS